MKVIICSLFIFILLGKQINAQENMDYFLPDDVAFDPGIPTPESFFHQKMGERHLNYEQVLSYINEIARLSERAVISEYTRSYENRPLVHLIFTSEENHGKLDQLKDLHYKFSEPGAGIMAEKVPLVVLLG